MISVSPCGERFRYSIDAESENLRIDSFSSGARTVVVQGLGFVGTAMTAALAGARRPDGKTAFKVIGVDLPDENNYWKIGRINKGLSAVLSSDKALDAALKNGRKKKSVMATYSDYAYRKADIVVVDINLDIKKGPADDPGAYDFSYGQFEGAIRTLARNVREGTLIIVETTVPPGTTSTLIYPIFKEEFRQRGLDVTKLHLAYSYERVMPGPNYLNSVTDFYRVYAGINRQSSLRARKFFESFVNTKSYPLYELRSTVDAEMAKLLENSFRAVNIAFIQEWAAFAHKAGVNLFEVINAIKARPTHKNIMSPGFGVGGYCLPKDPLLADWSYARSFSSKGRLKMTLDAVATNDLMPDYTLKILKEEMGPLKGKHVTILGVSYLGDVADTRNSPTALFYDRCRKEGAIVHLHDPMVTMWKEKGIRIDTDIGHLRRSRHDAVVFAVRHKKYLGLTAGKILSILKGVKIIVDANNMISDETAGILAARGVKMLGVGKGHWAMSEKAG